MKYIIALSFLVLSSCGSTGPQGEAGSVAYVPDPSPSESVQQQIVDQQNAYRATVGQEPLTPGLSCTLYSISQLTTCLLQTNPASCVVWTTNPYVNEGSWEYEGVFNSAQGNAGVSFMPQALQNLYKAWYEITCTGTLVNADNNYHEFDTDSDDGSLLYIDGSLVVNNDGIHALIDKSGTKFLEYGIHSIQVNYFQAGGVEGFVLNEDGNVMSNAGYYH